MPLKIITAFLAATLALAAACQAGRVGIAHHLNTQMPFHDLMSYGSNDFECTRWRAMPALQLRVATQWQTVTFEKPLQINRRGTMGLHLVVDQEPYISTLDDHPLNPECNKPGCYKNAACLRHLSDGALVRPEAVLVGDNGEEVKVRPEGHLFPSFDKHVMTVILATFKDVNSPAPPFPEGIRRITAMRIRSTTPFLVRYLWWKVDNHPELYSR